MDEDAIESSETYPELSKICSWRYNPNLASGYYYFIQTDDADLHITPNGVSACRMDGTCTTSSLIPNELFGESEMLTDEQLCFIVNRPVKGTKCSKEEMDLAYKEYLAS